MKTVNALSVVFVNVALTAQLALAGGVSHGGGGTTNPDPTTPIKVMQALTLPSLPALVFYLYEAERTYSSFSPQEKLKSPFRKLFPPAPARDIFALVRNPRIDLFWTKPCRDYDGAAYDGSVVATRVDAVCLSPFTMAPKLNKYNVQAETLALLLHELSHLLGTTEAEAVSVQISALEALSEMGIDDVISKAGDLAQEYGGMSLIADISRSASVLGDAPDVTDVQQRLWVQDLVGKFEQFRSGVQLSVGNAMAVRSNSEKRLSAESLRLWVLAQAYCDSCQQDLNDIFHGKESATVDEIRKAHGSKAYASPYGSIVIRNPKSKAAIKDSFQDFSSAIEKVRREMDKDISRTYPDMKDFN